MARDPSLNVVLYVIIFDVCINYYHFHSFTFNELIR